MKYFVAGIGILVAAAVLAIGGLITFGTSAPPPVLKSITLPFAMMDFSTLPSIERYRARDGVELGYRAYSAGRNQVAFLIHGSAGSSSDMHALALALQRNGISVVVPDLRGHGDNFPHGDISYVGQLDDDMADLLDALRPRFPEAVRTLVGFSSGGGFALRIAADAPLGKQFAKVVLLAPYLRFDSPTLRSNAPQGTKDTDGGNSTSTSQGAWATANVGRIIGLTILDRFGVHAFDGLPVVAFAVPPNVPSVTAAYSWRLQKNFAPHDDYFADIHAVPAPMQVFVGSSDELFIPDQVQKLFHEQQPEVLVKVLPGLNHSAMVTSPDAIEAVVYACKKDPIG